MDVGVGDLHVLKEFNSCCVYSAPYSCYSYNRWEYPGWDRSGWRTAYLSSF
jgi:hypothetical protein